METPSSTRRVTRSQTGALASGKAKGEAEKSLPKSQLSKIDRVVLVDITNDSPIVGVAMAGNLKSPISDLMRSRSHQPKKTPGSGEALLRGQVKTLLQKVEEDAEFVKLTVDRSCPFGGIARSPMALLAPTPANTPYLGCGGLDGFSEIAKVVEEVEVIDEIKVQVTEHSEKEALDLSECMINRALLFDSPGKSDVSDSSTMGSAVTYQGSSCKEDMLEDDDDDDGNSSHWSLQVNTSSPKQVSDAVVEDNNGEEEVEEEEEEDEEYEEGFEEEASIDDLCEGLKNMTVKGGGRHIRFIYNSEDEIEREDEASPVSGSPNVLHLKGLPTPKGKHFRFPEDDGEN